jgi:chromosome segregation ATPase
MTPRKTYIITKRLGDIKIQETYLAELQDHASRRGELKKKTQAEIDSLKQQIDNARTERDAARVLLDNSRIEKAATKAALIATRAEKQATKDSLSALKTQKQAEKAALQIQLDAAVGAAAKDPIRAQRDAVTAEINSLTAQIDALNIEIASLSAEIDALTLEIDDLKKQIDQLSSLIDSLRLAKENALLDERYLKNQLLDADLPIIAQRKEALARDIEEKRQALKAKGLLDDPRAAERLAHRAKMKIVLEQLLAE